MTRDQIAEVMSQKLEGCPLAHLTRSYRTRVLAAADAILALDGWQTMDSYEARVLGDLRRATEGVATDGDLPNYASWPIELPAGHWRALHMLIDPLPPAPTGEA